jgi:hypothetical protein
MEANKNLSRWVRQHCKARCILGIALSEQIVCPALNTDLIATYLVYLQDNSFLDT